MDKAPSESERSFHSSVRYLLLEAARHSDAASTTSNRPISRKSRSKNGSRTYSSDTKQYYRMLQRPLSPLRSGSSGEALYTPMRTASSGTDVARKRRRLKKKSSIQLGMDHSLDSVHRLAQKCRVCVAAVEPRAPLPVTRRLPTVARLHGRLLTAICTCEIDIQPSYCKDCDRLRAEASLQRAQLQKAALENRVFGKKADRYLAAVREELQQYKKSLQTASDLQSMASEKLAALRAEMSEAKQAHTQAEGVAKAMKMSLAGQQKSNASLYKTNESLRSSVYEKDGWIQSLQYELASIKASSYSHEAAAQQSDRSEQLLKVELGTAKRAAEQARSRNQALQIEVNELNRDLEQSRGKLERFQSEVDSLRKSASDQAELHASLDDWKDRASQAESREQFLKSKLGELIEKRKQDRVQMERTAAASAVSLHVTSPTVIVRVTNEINETADEQRVLPVLPRAEIREALIDVLCSRTRIVARKGATGGNDPRDYIRAGQSLGVEGPLHGARRGAGYGTGTRDEAWAKQVAEEMQGGILEALEPLFEKTGAVVQTEAAGKTGASSEACGRPVAAGVSAGYASTT